jgi:hypothetical protein
MNLAVPLCYGDGANFGLEIEVGEVARQLAENIRQALNRCTTTWLIAAPSARNDRVHRQALRRTLSNGLIRKISVRHKTSLREQ